MKDSNTGGDNLQPRLETSLSNAGGVVPAKTAKALDRDSLAVNAPLPLPGAARVPVDGSFPADLSLFLGSLFVPGDSVLIRPIETWKDPDTGKAASPAA